MYGKPSITRFICHWPFFCNIFSWQVGNFFFKKFWAVFKLMVKLSPHLKICLNQGALFAISFLLILLISPHPLVCRGEELYHINECNELLQTRGTWWISKLSFQIFTSLLSPRASERITAKVSTFIIIKSFKFYNLGKLFYNQLLDKTISFVKTRKYNISLQFF